MSSTHTDKSDSLTRHDADWHFVRVHGKVGGLMNADAAYADMKALEAERDRLRDELEKLRANTDRDPSCIYYEARIYRKALERIAEGAGNGRPSLDAAQAMYLAREALDV